MESLFTGQYEDYFRDLLAEGGLLANIAIHIHNLDQTMQICRRDGDPVMYEYFEHQRDRNIEMLHDGSAEMHSLAKVFMDLYGLE